MSYPEGPTSEAQVDSTEYESELLGENDMGSVHLHGPFGNSNSEIRIAYVIGMHPLESKSHRALFDELTSRKDLNYCYYLYNIYVNDVESESEGRMEGQLLAREFVTSDIIDKKYDLFLDIHSNRGTIGPGNYEITNFLFAPGFDEKSTEYVNALLDLIPDLQYYAPEHRTSPPFITEPTAEAGIPTIVYECYTFEEIEVTYDLASKLVKSVENLNISL